MQNMSRNSTVVMIFTLFALLAPFASVKALAANISRIDMSFKGNNEWIARNDNTSEIEILKDWNEDENIMLQYEFDQGSEEVIQDSAVDLCNPEDSLDKAMVDILFTAMGIEGSSCPITPQSNPEQINFVQEIDSDQIDPDCLQTWSIDMRLVSGQEDIAQFEFFVDNNDCDVDEKMASEEDEESAKE